MSTQLADPMASALRYVTDPFARGAATQLLELGAANDGVSAVRSYSFEVFEARYGVAQADPSYVLTLRSDLGSGPRTVEVDYQALSGSGTVRLEVPAGTLPGISFALPLPRHDGRLLLTALRERPAPAAGEPSGPAKWSVTALLGNFGRLLWVMLGERQVLAATAADVASQRHLLAARGASLDRLGEAVGVARLLPAPYRLDLDTGTLALYHLDDAVAPVLDATGEHPGTSHGALRGLPGRFGAACGIGPQGGITVPDAAAFEIGRRASFTVELFARLAPGALPGPGPAGVLACKRPHLDDNGSPGWHLAIEAQGSPAGPAASAGPRLAFRVTDRSGLAVAAVSGAVDLGTGWFHVAGVLDRKSGQVGVYLNGSRLAGVSLGRLGAIGNCADIGLGADRLGRPHLNGQLDEVRLSAVARSDFSPVLGTGAAPYRKDAATIALYHLDATDDWIDEARGIHYAINHGATRGAPGRFGSGLRLAGDPLPEPRCATEREFQRLLRAGLWDRSQGGAMVRRGPYARYGFRQGALSLPGIDGEAHPVHVNDQDDVGTPAQGRATTACYGFVPENLEDTIAAFAAARRSPQEAIDYFGEWHGEPEAWFAQQYAQHGIHAPHEPCPIPAGTPSSARVPGAADLAWGPSASFTVEAIVRPDAMEDDYPRAIAASRSSGLREGEANAGEPGWALTVGGYRCIADNLRWTVGDAAGTLVAVEAGFSLADGAFHHVAGVLDRDAEVALLFVDGAEVGQAPLGGLGAAATASDVFLGNSPALDAPYAGLLDEVRLSSVARRSFHPVLGEGDERYRQRLAIYQPWRLPTVATLQRGVRALSLAGPTAAAVAPQATELLLGDGAPPDAGQLDVLETDSTRFCASRRLRVVPATLRPGQSIAADGTMPAPAPAGPGSGTFHREALLRHADAPGMTFPSEAGRWMVLPAALLLEALAARVLAVDPQARVSVERAWEPGGADLHREGRALAVTLQQGGGRLDLGRLGALAHVAGAASAAYERSGGRGRVYMSAAPGFELDLDGPGVAPLGQPVRLSVRRPVLRDASALQWRLLRCGTGDGAAAGSPDGSCLLTGTAPGELAVEVTYPLADGAFLLGARRLIVAPETLDGCAVLAGDGREDVTEAEVCGAPDRDFRTEYLVRSDDPRLDYASAAARRMQLPLEVALRKLAVLAAAEPGGPRVTVLAAFDGGAATLQAVGRGLVVAPSSAALSAARLGALAFLAGFGYIERRRYPPSVYVSVPPGERFTIERGPIRRLWPNARISGQGEFQAEELAAAGPPDAGFNGGMLQAFAGSGFSFAPGVSRSVQPSLASALTALAAVLRSDGVTGDVQVLAGFDPHAPGLARVGRAVLMRHPTLGADRLCGYALQAGFGFVQHRAGASGGPAAYAAAYPAAGGPPAMFGDGDAVLDSLAELRVRPELALAGQLEWCVMASCPAAAALSTALPDPAAPPGTIDKILRGTATGDIAVTASFSLDDAAAPYQFLLVPRAEGASPRLTKDQYDDLMNFLAAYHPLGIAAATRDIRRFVFGFPRPLRWDDLPAARTYARYRVGP